MIIKYGITNNSTDVTQICLSELTRNNIITIPSGEINRTRHFTDVLPGILKKIIITIDNVTTQYDYYYTIKINLTDNTVTIVSDIDIHNKLVGIHSQLKMNYGNFNEEVPEQKMAIRYLTGTEKF